MKNYFEDIIKTTASLVSYNTVMEKATTNAPFGKANRDCLDEFLNLGKSMGFTVKNIDGFAGHIEYAGKSDEILGILGHLDIVPAGNGWDTDPFVCTVKDGNLYGRGVVDNKGPMVVCLYALKKLKDSGFVPKMTIRLIVGCNEESGQACINRYFETETMPEIGFSPDAEFPLIHCEKGIAWTKYQLPVKLKNFTYCYGGDKCNMVAMDAYAMYNGQLTEDYFIAKGLEASKVNGEIKIVAKGKAAHGSMPEYGENAIWKLLRVVSEVEECENLKFFTKSFCFDYTGAASNLVCSDENSGSLTQNLGQLVVKNGLLTAEIDIRYPIMTDFDKIKEILTASAPTEVSVSYIYGHAPLYVDRNAPLVKTLMQVYFDHTNDSSKSLIIGGGTYARSLKMGVGFGPVFDVKTSTIHMPNEHISLEELSLICEIYYDAIYKLSI